MNPPTMLRNARIDVARGMLMLYIIAIVHPFYWLNVYNGPGKSLVLFEMPCIFFIAGYAYALSLQNGMRMDGGADLLNYMVKRGARVLIPYWAYAAVCLCFIFAQGDPALSDSAHASWATVSAWLNPINFGGARTFSQLNSHLWFVAPVLGVTFLTPLAAKLANAARLPLFALIVVGGVAIFAATTLALGYFTQTFITYTFWSLFGHAVAARRFGAFMSRWQCLAIAAIAGQAVVIAGLMGWTTLDIQTQKFPPTTTFFLFSLSAFCLLWTATSFISERAIAYLRTAFWFRPFVNRGYSIYMWQGLAFTFAQYLGVQFALPFQAVWLIAVVGAVLIGVAASPLESLGFSLAAKRAVQPVAE